jgi:Equine arteritis virus serine endopeptidase S32
VIDGAPRIVNARGVPGTASAIVADANGTRYLLTCYHVLFGADAKPGEPIWLGDMRTRVRIGVSTRGQLGRVTYGGEHYFIDVGIAELAADVPAEIAEALVSATAATGVGSARPGTRVSKHGPISGLTSGVVAAIDHFEQPHVGGRSYQASHQLLIHGDDAELGFSVAGDSGAAVRDRDGRLVGVLWGSNASGDGVASPIVPALDHLAVKICEAS